MSSPQFSFKRAVKSESKLRLALIGPSGSGKTFTGLTFAKALSRLRVAVIDTERGSASKYADLFDFDVLELERHSPDDYRSAIDSCVAGGAHDVILIDSLSHAWMGRDGALEQVDKEAMRSKTGNSFAAWRSITPMHNKLVDALVGAPLHVLATMRSKTEWVVEKNEKGQSVPRKIGTAAVQRDGLEYEFDVVADMDQEGNRMIVSKTRCPDLHGMAIEKPGPEVAELLKRWLSGVASPFGRAVNAVMSSRTQGELAAAAEIAKSLSGIDRERMRPIFAARRDRIMAAATEAQAAAATVVSVSESPEQGEAQMPVDPPFVDDVVQDEATAEVEEAPPQPDHALAPTKATSDQVAAAQAPLSPHLPSWATPRELQGLIGKVKDDQQKTRTVYLYTEAMINPPRVPKVGDVMYRFLPGGADKPQMLEWTGTSWDVLPSYDPLIECVRAALANDIKSRNRICQLGSSMLLALAKDRITEQVFTDLKDLTVRSLVLLRAAMAELQKKGSPE